MKWLYPFLLFLSVFFCSSLHAQDQQDDIRRTLDQRSKQQAIQHERDLLKGELDSDRPTITVDGRAYTVEHNANDVGRALYLSLQNKQWDVARHFLTEYLTLPDRDPTLVHYAQGEMARVQGHYREALREFRALLALQPDFLLGRLELARTLFEDQQDREASELFAAIDASVDADDPKTAGVRKTLAIFRKALENRSAWNGSYALGPAWSDNVNRTSASHTCLYYYEGLCFYDRTTPDAIASAGYDFDANLGKRFALHGHNGLYVSALAFGQTWLNNSAYNELSASVQGGYSYHSGRDNFELAPSFDYYALGDSMLYGAWGLHGDWSHTLSPVSVFKVEGDWKDLRYRNPAYASNYTGVMRSVSTTYYRSLGTHWTLFGGVDFMDSHAPIAANAYLQKGIRLGGSLQWPAGFSSTLFASRRWRGYGAYSALLGARRDDREDNVILVVKANRWSFAGFVPLLTLRYNTVKSNVDWLYTYDKNFASLKLERAF